MEEFKRYWEIEQNWQLLFPFSGMLLLGFSAFKLIYVFTNDLPYPFLIFSIILLTFFLIKICLFLFKKLENKWIVKNRWEMIRIFLVFSVTGSSSIFIGRPFIKLLGITPENLNIGVYWFLYLSIAMIFYQIFLVFFGWLFGQFQFFWEFEKKMLRRFGLGRFLV